ncbi:PaaI family thioesterase [Desulfospira joergensenii]|uniref:PaaI family thioesterase n=1 Tax=Desulfospira joergensenii TaxID=53329 RepID=UPI0003B48FED|nr:PaaI family thioesterase [Desulfospira joergensenii]
MKSKSEKTAEFPSLSTGPHDVRLEKWISCSPFERLLGIEILEARNGHSLLTMPFVRRLSQGAGLVHGGAMVTLADTAVAMAVKSLVSPGSRFGTISLTSEFLAPVTQGVLTAKADVTLVDDRLLRGDCSLTDAEDREVMKFTSRFKLARDVKLL